MFQSLVDNLARPIIVFQTITPIESSKCVYLNKAMTELCGGVSMVGAKFGEAFPGLLKLYKTKHADVLEAVSYEDKYVPRDLYTVIFHTLDSAKLAIKIEHISDELKAKRLADEMTETKEQFVANISHEIRTPLNGIIGYISMLTDPKELSSLSDYQKNCVEQIHDCSMTLLAIMNDILDFSKLNADQMELQSAPFDLAECLEKSYDVIKPSANQKGLDAAFYIYPNVPPRIKGDFKRLRQVLLNLLSNGIKFTKRGRIDTTVALVYDPVTKTELDTHGCYTIEFTVEDTGMGISAANQLKLFKSFSQIDQSSQKSHSGTGLGLVISKKLIELMGGDIRVESAEGEGTKFIFTIKAEEARAISADTNDEFLPLLKDKSVLIVDDHVTNRITIASNLVQWGMKPFVCGSAANQLKLFKSFSQIDQSSQKSHSGTGLGLVISKKLIELMGGDIRVESAEGEGTKFIFTIKAEEARAISADTNDEFLPLLKDKSVLIVDDHVTNRITIASNLVQWGMKPFVCGSAEEALLYLRSGILQFEFALIDMRMPKMDGNELADKIKDIEPELPLIAISSTVLSASSTLNKNFSFYLSKPIKSRQLFNVCVATVKKLLASSSQLTPPSPPLLPPPLASPANHSYPLLSCLQHGRSVLIAEDLETNQRVIKGYLE